MPIRILIADDHKIFREGLRTLLQNRGDIEVIGEADNGRTLVALAAELRPEVIIMDVAMPDLNGLEKIFEQGLCGFEAVKAYLTELYRRDCRPNTLRTLAVTIISYLVYLKSCGVDRLEALLWIA